MISTSQITKFWESTFPGCPPVSYFLRDAFPNRWVRFHSLPDSQRYPNDEFEMSIVLNRHNTVLGELAAPKEDLILVSVGYSDTCEPTPSELIEQDLFSASSLWQSLAMHEIEPHEDDPVQRFWHLFQIPVAWQQGVFDSVLRLVAEDEIGNIMIMSINGQWIYHPYDGGADVILAKENQRDAIKNRHQDWLSKHPKRL